MQSVWPCCGRERGQWILCYGQLSYGWVVVRGDGVAKRSNVAGGCSRFVSFVADLDDAHAGVLMPVVSMIDGACHVLAMFAT